MPLERPRRRGPRDRRSPRARRFGRLPRDNSNSNNAGSVRLAPSPDGNDQPRTSCSSTEDREETLGRVVAVPCCIGERLGSASGSAPRARSLRVPKNRAVAASFSFLLRILAFSAQHLCAAPPGSVQQSNLHETRPRDYSAPRYLPTSVVAR